MATFYVGPRPVLRGVNTNDMVNPYTSMTGEAKGKGTYSYYPLYNTSHVLTGAPDNNHVPGTGYAPGDVFMSQIFRGVPSISTHFLEHSQTERQHMTEQDSVQWNIKAYRVLRLSQVLSATLIDQVTIAIIIISLMVLLLLISLQVQVTAQEQKHRAHQVHLGYLDQMSHTL